MQADSDSSQRPSDARAWNPTEGDNWVADARRYAKDLSSAREAEASGESPPHPLSRRATLEAVRRFIPRP